jgi:hypothetical protein
MTVIQTRRYVQNNYFLIFLACLFLVIKQLFPIENTHACTIITAREIAKGDKITVKYQDTRYYAAQVWIRKTCPS